MSRRLALVVLGATAAGVLAAGCSTPSSAGLHDDMASSSDHGPSVSPLPMRDRIQTVSSSAVPSNHDSVPAASPGVGAAAQDGTVLIQKAQEAIAQTDFEGVMESRTLGAKGWMVMDVGAHYKKPRMARLEYRTGPEAGMIVVRKNGSAWRYDPHTHQVVLTQKPATVQGKRQSLLRQNFRAVLGPHTRVAGREAIQVDLVPRTGRRHWSRYWIDSITSVLLGQEHYGEDNHLESSSRFQSVSFRLQPDSLFEPPRGDSVKAPMETTRPVTLAKLQQQVGFALTQPGWLPSGYRVEGNYLSECEDGCRAPVAVTRYTDGMETITLFQSKHVTDQAEKYIVRTRGNQHEVRIARNKVDFVVVGDQDPQQLTKIATSIPSPVK